MSTWTADSRYTADSGLTADGLEPSPGNITNLTAFDQSGIQSAEPAFLAGGACTIVATYVNLAGNAYVPSAVAYRVDDVISGQNIVPLTSITPALENQVTVSAAQNAMVSLSLDSEQRQVVFNVTDAYGTVTRARLFYYLVPSLDEDEGNDY